MEFASQIIPETQNKPVINDFTKFKKSLLIALKGAVIQDNTVKYKNIIGI
jgi:hypothetical protein